MWPFLIPTIEVVTFCLHGWCMLGVLLLPLFACQGHSCQGLLSLCDGMHVCTDLTLVYTGVALMRKNCVFFTQKRAGYANLKMLYVYCTQKTVTSHLKTHLVFVFLHPAEKVCRALAVGLNILDFPRPLLPPFPIAS